MHATLVPLGVSAGAIVSLSLGGATVMEFRQGDDHRALVLPPRSLLLLTDEARYSW